MSELAIPQEFLDAVTALKQRLPYFAAHYTDNELMQVVIVVAEALLEREDEDDG